MRSFHFQKKFLFICINISSLIGCRMYAQTIGGGFSHTLVLCNNGTIWGCGANSTGALGTGSTNTTPNVVPAQAAGLNSVIGVVGGAIHSAALLKDGTVWTWGDNTFGELGIGSFIQKTAPTKVTDISNAIQLAAGNHTTVVLKNDGTVWICGDNKWGQCPLGPVKSNTFLKVTSLTDIKSIAAGAEHVIALKKDGTVWNWGGNSVHQLGDGTKTSRLLTNNQLPVQPVGLSNIVAISCNGGYRTLALKSDGTVWAWGGNNTDGELGNGTMSPANEMAKDSVPNKVIGLTDIIAISSGYAHNLALKSDGTVWAWGSNGSGRLGDGTITDRATPVKVPLSGIVEVAAFQGSSYALKSDGTVWSWGFNQDGELGWGTPGGFANKVPKQMQLSCKGLVGIENLGKAMSFQVNVYPNPSAGEISVGYQSDVPQQAQLYIYNTSGSLQKAYTLEPGNNQLMIRGGELPPGLYLYEARINNGNGRATGRFLIIE